MPRSAVCMTVSVTPAWAALGRARDSMRRCSRTSVTFSASSLDSGIYSAAADAVGGDRDRNGARTCGKTSPWNSKRQFSELRSRLRTANRRIATSAADQGALVAKLLRHAGLVVAAGRYAINRVFSALPGLARIAKARG